jgi:hypothetical protein
VSSVSSSSNAVLTNLLQTLSNAGSPLASSPTVLSALQNASPGDLVQLSTAATQLESVDAIFGFSDGSASNSSTSPLTTLDNLLTSTSSGTSSGLDSLLSTTSGNTSSNLESLITGSETLNLFNNGESSTTPNLLNVLG